MSCGNRAVNFKTLLLTCLPIDVPCCPHIEAFTVPEDDPRVALCGQQGARVAASCGRKLPKGTLIGLYRGRMSFFETYQDYKFEALEVGPNQDCASLVDSYAATFEVSMPRQRAAAAAAAAASLPSAAPDACRALLTLTSTPPLLFSAEIQPVLCLQSDRAEAGVYVQGARAQRPLPE